MASVFLRTPPNLTFREFASVVLLRLLMNTIHELALTLGREPGNLNRAFSVRQLGEYITEDYQISELRIPAPVVGE